MRARSGMTKECADLVSRFRGKNVLELAGLLFNLGLAVHGKTVSKQPLSQAVPADDVARAARVALDFLRLKHDIPPIHPASIPAIS